MRPDSARQCGVRRVLAALVCLGVLVVGAVVQPGSAAAATTRGWWFDAWNLDQLWGAGADGRGITVAVLDTGVQADIPQLAGRVLHGADFSGSGTDGRRDLDSNDFSHGTAMASLIVARPGVADVEGAAPGSQILPVVVPLAGEVPHASPPSSATAAAIRYAADRGARVITMSFGSARYPDTDSLSCPADVQAAVSYAILKGSLLVASAGNSGTDGSPTMQPGVCLGVVSVGAVTSDRQAAAFSSRQPYLTISAPGEQIDTLSKSNGLAYRGNGTSQATALAAAALAVLWSRHPAESNAQILTRLLASVTDLGTSGRDDAFGYGFVNLSAAVARPSPVSAVNPVFTAAEPLLALARTAARSPSGVPDAGSTTAPLGLVTVVRSESRLPARFWVLAGGAGVLGVLVLALIIAARRSGRGGLDVVAGAAGGIAVPPQGGTLR